VEVNMKAVYFPGKNEIVVRDVPEPEIKEPDEVLVKIKTAGLCGSDLHFLKEGRISEYIQGHEGAGVVVGTGANVKEFKAGDRVSLYHKTGCGDCAYCRQGFISMCAQGKGQAWHRDGVDAEYYVVDKKYVLKLPDELSFYDGSMIACGAGTAFSAISKLGLSRSESVVIFGLGPLGLACTKVAKGYGARVIGVEINPVRREMARQIGIDDVIDGSKEDVISRVKELEPFGVRCVVDVSGNRLARAKAVELVAPNGKVAFVGMRDQLNTIFDIDNMIRKQVTILGSYVYPLTMWDSMRDFFLRNKISFDDLVTHTYRLDEAEKAFREFGAGMEGKAIFVVG
jgi:threonine dehydrogenase-like Zn-dependent dehydrogenase